MEEEIGKPSWPISTAPSQARRPTTRQGEDALTFFSESLPVGPCCHPFPFGPLCFTKTEHGWDPIPLPRLSPSKHGRLAVDGWITVTHDPSLTFPIWRPTGAHPACAHANGTPAIPVFPPSSCSSRAATVSLLRAYGNDHDSDHWTLLSRRK